MNIDRARQAVKELLETGEARIIIGYESGINNTVHAGFAISPDETAMLIFDGRCVQNLAVYLVKPEIHELGKPAIFANVHTLRSILQLMNEYQVADNGIIIFAEDPNSDFVKLEDAASVAAHLEKTSFEYLPGDRDLVSKIDTMSTEERRKFWKDELSRCIKCYACRSQCPLCYCTRCTVECNQPQWIQVPSHELGNMEWHIMRGMHLSGRCVNCGACYRACPVSIPLHLLTIKTADVIEENFGVRAGTIADHTHVMSAFKPDDKENFIR